MFELFFSSSVRFQLVQRPLKLFFWRCEAVSLYFYKFHESYSWDEYFFFFFFSEAKKKKNHMEPSLVCTKSIALVQSCFSPKTAGQVEQSDLVHCHVESATNLWIMYLAAYDIQHSRDGARFLNNTVWWQSDLQENIHGELHPHFQILTDNWA